MERRAIAIRGTVQGVGFRPFVDTLASRLSLSGFVRIDIGGVAIEAKGDSERLDAFLASLRADAPPLARIESLSWLPRDVVGEHGFRIESSHGDGSGPIDIAPDVVTCDACLAELFDPYERRFCYPFINCR